MGDIREYLKLIKFHSVGFTTVIPIIGAAATGELNWQIFFQLGIVGVLVHIFGFAMNEHRDIEIDRRASELRSKPLVKGTISPKTAFWTYQVAWILALAVNFLFFRHLLSVGLLAASILFGALYNLYSKKLAYVEILLAVWTFLFVLSGNAAVHGQVDRLGVMVAVISFFQILFNTGISGAFKDCDHDPVGKGETTPLRMGVRVHRGKISVPGKFILYSFLVKSAQVTAIMLPLALGTVQNEGTEQAFKLITLVILALLVFYCTKYFLSIKNFNRDKILKPLAAIEVFSFMMAPVMLLGVIDRIELAVLAIYPFALAVPLVPLIYKRIIPVV